ncbi:uncharacterized protein [Triticum aestivum]|uniref:uncharacterized protein n=1 Tax=Triticum aestivum TaxID=4565 RepID=UPI001D017ADB|nr:uncharacterized protein LOC123163213 [Triticum aestivum]
MCACTSSIHSLARLLPRIFRAYDCWSFHLCASPSYGAMRSEPMNTDNINYVCGSPHVLLEQEKRRRRGWMSKDQKDQKKKGKGDGAMCMSMEVLLLWVGAAAVAGAAVSPSKQVVVYLRHISVLLDVLHHLILSLAASVPVAFVLIGGTVQGATPMQRRGCAV